MRPRPARLPILRRPDPRRAAAAALAALAGVLVFATVSRAGAAAAALGDTTTVWLSEVDLGPGTTIDASMVVARSVPRSLVPPLAHPTDPTGAVVRHGIVAGEVVVSTRLAEGSEGPRALVPAGWRALAVPVVDVVPPVAVGDRVDLLAVGAAAAGPAVAVATDVVVIDATERAITIAVPASRAPAVATALVSAAVVISLVG